MSVTEAQQQVLFVSPSLTFFSTQLQTSVCYMQLREKAAVAKEEAGGLAPLAHSVLEAQKEEQRRAAELAALKRCALKPCHCAGLYNHWPSLLCCALDPATLQALATVGHFWHELGLCVMLAVTACC